MLGVAGCGGSGDDVDGDVTTTSTTSTSLSAPTTATSTGGNGAGSSTTTTSTAGSAFQGSTTPTSAPTPPGTEVALLADVRVAGQQGFDRVVFEFADSQLPGYDISYLDGPAIQDGSGEEVEVAGGSALEVRLAPASGVDLRRGTFEPTYTGQRRVRGDTEVVTEVVRIGDFEANLTWVIGLDEMVPYRVEVLSNPARVVIDLAVA
ncbi:MAG: hypothetical protein KY450_01825 [Actinobacteria bacterium]|nr:hypothetical protein [Actinomycetota bacterium]